MSNHHAVIFSAKHNTPLFYQCLSQHRKLCIVFSFLATVGCADTSNSSEESVDLQNKDTKSYSIDSIVAINPSESSENSSHIDDTKLYADMMVGINASQVFYGGTDIEKRLKESLPEIYYTTDNLAEFAQKVNNAQWQKNKLLDKATIIKIQALLNWHSHGVGAVNGQFSSNTIKALEAFQKANGIKGSGKMTALTWQLLNTNSRLIDRPVLVNYVLTDEDTHLPSQRKNTQYHSIKEAIAEKFHMSRGLLKQLNPNIDLKASNVITVYNPSQPNLKPISHIEVYKQKNLLVAYDDKKQVVASYPTTIGSNTPNGTHKVVNRVHKPYYNSDFSDKSATKPPGPNNPVGLVWMGLSKPSFGLHGSPQPEMISKQRSGGCVRLTNWDALSLYGTIQDKAIVQFKNQ